MPPRPNLEPTTTQKQVLECYRAFADEHGYPPSVAYLVAQLGMQRSTVYQAIDCLESKGFLKKRPITIKRLMPVKRKEPPPKG